MNHLVCYDQPLHLEPLLKKSLSPSDPPSSSTLPTTSSLFEDESPEYDVSFSPSTHPPRSFVPPWPTIFSSTSSSTSSIPPSTSDIPIRQPISFTPNSRYARRRHHSSQLYRPTRDLIKYIRWSPDPPTARQILHDLLEIGVHIKPSRLYLHAAIQLLTKPPLRGNRASEQQVKEDVLMWLSLAPKVRGSMYAPKYAAWARLFTEALLQAFPRDAVYLEEVLKTCARSKSLPPFMNGILGHLVVLLGPRKSHEVLNTLIGIWCEELVSEEGRKQAPPPSAVDSEGGQVSLPTQDSQSLLTISLVRQSNTWRNAYLRSLLRAGYLDEGRQLFEHGEERGVVWEERTKWSLVRALRRSGPTAVRERDAGAGAKEAEQEDLEEAVEELQVPLPAMAGNDVVFPQAIRTLLGRQLVSPTRASFEALSLGKKIRLLAKERQETPVRYLVGVMLDLGFMEGRAGLMRRLKGRFVRAQPDVPTGSGEASLGGAIDNLASRKLEPPSSASARFWYLAEIVKEREMGRHVEAVALFKEHFFWLGLPALADHSAAWITSLDEASAELAKTRTWAPSRLYPSKQVIAAVLPCILTLLLASTPTTSSGRTLEEHLRSNPSDSATTPSPSTLTPEELATYHTQLIASSVGLPSFIQPDEFTHLHFLRAMGRKYGSERLDKYARSIERSGAALGVVGWTSVAVSWAKSGDAARAIQILDGLASQSDRLGRPKGSRTGPPVLRPRSYLVVAMAMLQRKDKRGAATVLERMAGRWPGVVNPLAGEVSGLEADGEEDGGEERRMEGTG